MSYSPEIFEAAEKELEKRRLHSEMDLEKRRSILFARSPRAEEIERMIARTSVAAAKAIFSGADRREKLEALRDQNLALQNELNGIIKSFDFPENYLELWHKCSKCRDYGNIDGKMCSCMKSLLRQISYDRLNSISPLSLSTFDSFSLDYYEKTPMKDSKYSPNEIMSRVFTFCRRYTRTFSQSSRSLLFQGAPGLGKTHLSLAIASELIESGFGVIYASAPALLTKLNKESFDYERSSDEGSTEQLIADCDLLIIDDLGTEFSTRFSVSTLYNIINTRMIASKPIIISTNLTIAELQEKYNARIISRIIGSLDRVEFVGTDIRQQKRRGKKPKAAGTASTEML